jgi:hypothetical protein
MKARTATLRVWLPALVSAVFLSLAVSPHSESEGKNGKPTVSIKASPAMGFAPLRVVVTADIKGGPNDYEEFYCATVEWDIVSLDGKGDGNKSEQRLECDPYEAGKSEIKRRYIREQIFKFPGEYTIRFSLKQKNKVVGGGRTSLRVRGGLGDGTRH